MSVEQIRKRLKNQNDVLLALHRGGALRRSVLSEQLRIRKSSITSIVSDLLSRGVVAEEVVGASRSPIMVARESFHVATAFVEAGKVHTGRVSFSGRLTERATQPLGSGCGWAEVMDTVVAQLGRLVSPGRAGLAGVGVAIPGLVDPDTGTGVLAVNFRDWRNVPVRQTLEKRLGVRAMVGQDGRCQLLGNTWFWEGEHVPRNVLYLCVEDGVSCSIMVDGHILIGDHAAAGEIGSVRTDDPNGSGTGQFLQDSFSVPAILGHLREAAPDRTLENADDAAAALDQDPSLGPVLAGTLAPLVRQVSGFMALLDPELLLIGTESARFSKTLVPLFQRRLDIELRSLYARSAKVADALPTVDSALRGSAALVMRRCFATGEFPEAG